MQTLHANECGTPLGARKLYVSEGVCVCVCAWIYVLRFMRAIVSQPGIEGVSICMCVCVYV